MSSSSPTLRRSIGLVSLTLYGVGVTIGAGIYVLVGEMAGRAGSLAPLSFVVAALVAAFTALSYCELAARMPVASGEAAYVRVGLRSSRLAVAIGVMIMFVGMLSSATMLQGMAGYARVLIPLPREALILGALMMLGALAFWGVRASVWAAAVVTVIETGGLVWVVVAAAPHAVASPAPWEPAGVMGVLSAAVIAFFAFIGFEDIGKMAEETRRPETTVPRAILLTLVISTLLYVGVAWAAVRVVPPSELALAPDPVAEVLRRIDARGVAVIAGVASIAVVNGALIQILMASRLLYGMARKKLIPAVFARVHPRRRTPHVATFAACAVIAVLALTFPLGDLAQTTSFATLFAFAVVNLALMRIRAEPTRVPAAFTAPSWAPPLGFVSSLALGALGAFDLFSGR